MRGLIMTFLFVVVAGLAAIYIAYGQVDPCRTLAIEQARRAVGSHASGLVEPFTLLATSQMSSTECARGLLHSWRERIADALR